MRTLPKTRNRRARNAHKPRKRLEWCGTIIFVLAAFAEISGVNLWKLYEKFFTQPPAPTLISHPPSPPIESISIPQPVRKLGHVVSPTNTFNSQTTVSNISIKPLLLNAPALFGGGSQITVWRQLEKDDHTQICKYTSAGKPAYEIEVQTGFSMIPHNALATDKYPAVPPSCVPDKAAASK